MSNPVHVIYINGIGNEIMDVKDSKEKIEIILNESRNHQSSKLDFLVRYVWNPVGYNGIREFFNSELHDDYKELFLLKTSEEWFTAPFQEIIPDGHPTSQESIINAAGVINNYYEDMTPGFNSLESNGIINETDMASVKNSISELIEKIENNISNERPTIIVSHSQGNLLANLAYANLISRLGTSINKYIKFINVANISKFSINNLNLTHANDRTLIEFRNIPLVLNEAATRQNSTRNTPFCDGVCSFEVMEPAFSGSSSAGHSFSATYLSDSDLPSTTITSSTTTGSPNFTGIDFTSDKTTFRDRFEDFVYTAANSFDTSGLSSSPIKIASDIRLQYPSISNDGQYVAYDKGDVPRSTGQNNSSAVFLYNNISGKTTEISVNKSGEKPTGNVFAFSPKISRDGKKVVFRFSTDDKEESLTDEVITDRVINHIFIKDLETGEVKTVKGSYNPSSFSIDIFETNYDGSIVFYAKGNSIHRYDSNNDQSHEILTNLQGLVIYDVSDDGDTVLYRAYDSNISQTNVYTYDFRNENKTLISKKGEDSQAGVNSFDAKFSNTGEYIVYRSASSIFLYDLNKGSTSLIASGERPNVSNDGNYISFTGSNGLSIYNKQENKVTLLKSSSALFADLSGNGDYITYHYYEDSSQDKGDLFLQKTNSSNTETTTPREHKLFFDTDDFKEGNNVLLKRDNSSDSLSCQPGLCTVKGSSTNDVGLKLTPTLVDGYKFSHWIGIPECNTNFICNMTASGDMNIRMVFLPI